MQGTTKGTKSPKQAVKKTRKKGSGGSRPNAGRKKSGKTSVTFWISEENAKWIKAQENPSRLIDHMITIANHSSRIAEKAKNISGEFIKDSKTFEMISYHEHGHIDHEAFDKLLKRSQ